MADSSFDVRNGEPTSPWRQLQGLIGDAARVQARWARATVTAAQAAGRGGAPGPGDLLRNIGSEYQKYLRDLTALNLQYARAVQQLAAASGERFTEAVEDAAPPGRRVVDFPTPAESTIVVPPPAKRATSRRASGRSTKKAAARKTTATRTAAGKATAKQTSAKRPARKTAARKTAATTKAAAKAPARGRRTPPGRG